MKLKRALNTLLAAMLFAGSFGNVPAAHADTITVVPPKFELFGNPGDTLSEKIEVTNSSEVAVNYQVEVQDFTAEGTDGTPFLLDTGTPKTAYSLAQWITASPSSFTVPAGQEKVITVNIKIPKSGEPGGHYASVLVRRTGQSAPGAAQVDTRVGSLVLLRVSGNVTEQAKLDAFSTSSKFYQGTPVNFDINVNNSGNVHLAPTGTIVITNLFGKKVKEIPVSPATVLPGSTRISKAAWEESGLHVGRYTATYVSTYGQQKQTLSGSTTFIVFPLSLLWVTLAIIALIALFFTKRKSIKRIINKLTSD